MSAADERAVVMTQKMCERHRRDLIVHRLKIGPTEPWGATEIVAGMLLFQGATADPRIQARIGDVHGKAFGEAASLVLGEIGCLACWDRSLYQRVYRVLQKGLTHASLVSRGKIADEGFDLTGGAT